VVNRPTQCPLQTILAEVRHMSRLKLTSHPLQATCASSAKACMQSYDCYIVHSRCKARTKQASTHRTQQPITHAQHSWLPFIAFKGSRVTQTASEVAAALWLPMSYWLDALLPCFNNTTVPGRFQLPYKATNIHARAIAVA
jgi:hypothetical protein